MKRRTVIGPWISFSITCKRTLRINDQTLAMAMFIFEVQQLVAALLPSRHPLPGDAAFLVEVQHLETLVVRREGHHRGHPLQPPSFRNSVSERADGRNSASRGLGVSTGGKRCAPPWGTEFTPMSRGCGQADPPGTDASYFAKTIFPSAASAVMVSPSWKRPARISSESGSRRERWMARLSGRAP